MLLIEFVVIFIVVFFLFNVFKFDCFVWCVVWFFLVVERVMVDSCNLCNYDVGIEYGWGDIRGSFVLGIVFVNVCLVSEMWLRGKEVFCGSGLEVCKWLLLLEWCGVGGVYYDRGKLINLWWDCFFIVSYLCCFFVSVFLIVIFLNFNLDCGFGILFFVG